MQRNNGSRGSIPSTGASWVMHLCASCPAVEGHGQGSGDKVILTCWRDGRNMGYLQGSMKQWRGQWWLDDPDVVFGFPSGNSNQELDSFVCCSAAGMAAGAQEAASPSCLPAPSVMRWANFFCRSSACWASEVVKSAFPSWWTEQVQ